ncbi:MAG TPA: hypothetical protein VFB52_10025 [Solirubrobacterales bacterium]|nr:hypothetical protein [Solirubrobacterales bacterium]
MRWLVDAFAGIWSGIRGRSRVPRDHDQLWRHGEAEGAELGRQEGAQARGGEHALVDPAPTEAVIKGVVAARIATIGQRVARRYNRLLARADQWKRRGDRRVKRAKVLREARPEVEPRARAIEPFVARTLAYLASFGIVVVILETAGMWTSLEAFEGMIGWLRTPLSIAAGAVLALAGHVIGHLLAAAVEERSLRRGLISGALAVVVIGALAVVWLGVGRDANLRANDSFEQVGKLEATASQLDREANNLLRPTAVPLDGEEVIRPSVADRKAAARLNSQAETVRAKAAELGSDARDERTLDFFAMVQILGLAVGAVGGYFFAGAAPVREFKRLTGKAGREDRRASRRYKRSARWQAKADDVVAKVGRLVDAESAWGAADIARFQETRLITRGYPAGSWRSGTFTKEDLAELLTRTVTPADKNGSRPVRSTDSEGEE